MAAPSNAIASRVGGRGRSRTPSRFRPRFAALLAAALTVAACTATQSQSAVQPDAPGLLLGVWHGVIFPFAFAFSLFTDTIAVYAVPNQGIAYDVGFFIGVVVLGVGGSAARPRR